MPDHKKTLDRVNISEELSKTAAWKQLTYIENSNSPLSTSPKNDTVDTKRRRKRKRTREVVQKDTTSPKIHRKTSNSKKPVENYLLKGIKEHTKIQPEKKSTKREMKRQSSHDRGNKKVIGVETSLPPWEQPYQSPPRKDFGLLKIPENDLSIDPACSRSNSPKSDSCNARCSNAHTPINTPPHSSCSTSERTDDFRESTPVYSGDASWEEDGL